MSSSKSFLPSPLAVACEHSSQSRPDFSDSMFHGQLFVSFHDSLTKLNRSLRPQRSSATPGPNLFAPVARKAKWLLTKEDPRRITESPAVSKQFATRSSRRGLSRRTRNSASKSYEIRVRQLARTQQTLNSTCGPRVAQAQIGGKIYGRGGSRTTSMERAVTSGTRNQR